MRPAYGLGLEGSNLSYIVSHPTMDDPASDAIAMIVDVLRAKFGADALAVARRQSEEALPSSAAAWSEVVSRLSA